MSVYLADSADLTSVANAIRTKGGTSGQLAFPSDFVSAVQAIPTGETDYAKMLNVSKFYTGRIESDYAFQIKNNYAEHATWNAVFLPNASTSTSNNTASSHAFAYCTSLKTAVIGKPAILGQEMFMRNTALTAVDLGSTATRFVTALFSGCTKLNVLVIRRNGVCALLYTNVFDNTPFASGKAGGTLYVPQAQIAAYQAATNWSTILGYSTNSIQAIEGSAYENAYVDGTPIT